MRFNDKEISALCNGVNTIQLEGVLHHMKPQGNEWSDWYQQSSFKERMFKLVYNLLFYYRVHETEPMGLLILENAQVAYEQPRKGVFYAFSITFVDGGKHIFTCRCEEDVNKWISALKVASYNHWRSQFIVLKAKLSMRIGQDPVLDCIRRKQAPNPPKRKNKSMFYADLQPQSFNSVKITTTNIISTREVKVDNLIDI